MEDLLDGFLPIVQFVVALGNAWTTFHRTEEHRRIAADTEDGCYFGFLLRIEGIDIHLALVLLGYLLQDRVQLLAPTAPCGGEIDEAWFVADIFPLELLA